MLREIRPALVMLVALTLITGLAYPILLTGIAQIVFPYQAEGSLISKDGVTVGSALIGQDFTSDGYFHGRPSATTGPDPQDATKTVSSPYNASSSGGSNLGPTSKALAERLTADVEKLKAGNSGIAVPVDLVTTSGSGLDPHISPAAAEIQIARVAGARKLPEAEVRRLVAENAESPLAGIIGEPRVNVLVLNLALDRAAPR